MQNFPLPEQTLSSRQFGCWLAPDNSYRPAHQRFEASSDYRFVAMLDAYRNSGGLARCPELLALLKQRSVADVAILARWIVEREVICFEWQSQTWFPLFQFVRPEFVPDPRHFPILMELACIFDSAEVAYWFASPHPDLAESKPVDLLDSDMPAVLLAARATRRSAVAALGERGRRISLSVRKRTDLGEC